VKNEIHGRRTLAIVLAVYAIVTAILAWLIVSASGAMGYTLDDPYIHLSVAENLVEHGTYGVNPNEVAAPSSSILWPFLLVPFVALGMDPGIALALNVMFAIVAIAAMSAVTVRSLGRGILATSVAVAWLFAANVPGVVFTGMEHTLQLALAVLASLGTVRSLQNDQVDGWLWGVLAVAPLVRYESLAITLPLLGWLFLRGHRVGVVATGAANVASLGAFSAFLLSHDLGPLPSSVVAKSLHIEQNGGGVVGLVGNLLHNVLDWEGSLLLLLSFGAVGAALGADDRDRRWLGLAAAASGLLHLTFGRIGWFHRYEVYVVAYLYASIIAVAGPDLREWVDGSASRVAVLPVAIVVLGWSYVVGLTQIPAAATNIWGQQRQLHRLVADHLNEPVGVNDLGWTTYQNEQYVYDFLGLGSYRSVRHLRAEDPTKVWMDEAAEDHDLRLLIVSEFFFPEVPDEWARLGWLCLDAPAVTVAAPEVTLFARRSAYVDELRPKLERWAADLPPVARFEPTGCNGRDPSRE
jgi:hypothetical protein